jgi:hypothetical protein
MLYFRFTVPGGTSRRRFTSAKIAARRSLRCSSPPCSAGRIERLPNTVKRGRYCLPTGQQFGASGGCAQRVIARHDHRARKLSSQGREPQTKFHGLGFANTSEEPADSALRRVPGRAREGPWCGGLRSRLPWQGWTRRPLTGPPHGFAHFSFFRAPKLTSSAGLTKFACPIAQPVRPRCYTPLQRQTKFEIEVNAVTQNRAQPHWVEEPSVEFSAC